MVSDGGLSEEIEVTRKIKENEGERELDDEETAERQRSGESLFDRTSVAAGSAVVAAAVLLALLGDTATIGNARGVVVLGGAILGGAVTEFVTPDSGGAFGEAAIATATGCVLALVATAVPFALGVSLPVVGTVDGSAFARAALLALLSPLIAFPGGIGGVVGAWLREALATNRDDHDY